MNAKRILIIMLVLAAVLMVGLNAVSAQDNPGNGNGYGNGYGNRVGSGCVNCSYQTGQNNFQNGRNSNAPRGGWNADAPRGSGGYFGGGMFYRLPPASTDELPQDIVDLMIDGWLDEQHAYATYDAVIDQYGAVRPFANIQRSETQHIAAWEMLFDRYGIAVSDVPTFDLPEFASLTDACSVSAAAEVANFDLYDAMLAAFEPYPDLLYVAQSLRDASEFNHLPVFEMCAS